MTSTNLQILYQERSQISWTNRNWPRKTVWHEVSWSVSELVIGSTHDYLIISWA